MCACAGAPHYHILLWIKEAQLIGKDSSEEILAFIAKHTTCRIPDEVASPTLHKYVHSFQTHKCNSYCRRKYKNDAGQCYTHCRFGFPRATTHTAKLNDAFSSMRHRQKGKSSKRLYELPRTSKEIYINDYNPTLLLALGANIDVQYIGESSWSLAKYVTSYITKAEEVEMEELWQELTSKTLSQRLWSLGLKALTHRQCGAYEASDRLLGTHLYGKSASIRFVNTNEPHQRNRVLKPFKQLQELHVNDANSEDIYMNSFVDTYYPNRPDELEATSLYTFMRTYDRLPSVDKIPDGCMELKNRLGVLRKRTKFYIINHPKHNLQKSQEDAEKYYHSLLMLFLPWRTESELKAEHNSYADVFNAKKQELAEMAAYHAKLQNIVEAEELAQEKIVTDTQPGADQQDDCMNALQGHRVSEAENAMAEIRTAVLQSRCHATIDDVNKKIAQLNSDQNRIFQKIKHHLETVSETDNNLRLFVSGFGGTGKSYLINTIADWLYCQTEDTVPVQVSAPTGLVAFSIGGVTIHRLLMLPIEHGTAAKYQKLSPESLSIVRQTLQGLKLLIIDEISMVSSLLLTYIHLRLCEISGKQQLFGGINVLVLGDLLQLPPVKGNPPFVALKAEEIRNHLDSIGAVDLWRTFEYDELTINVRQSSDLQYASVLSNIRIGNPSVEDIRVLKTRLVADLKSDEQTAEFYQHLISTGQKPVCLLSKVDVCHQINQRMLQRIGVPIITIPSIDKFEGISNIKMKQIAEKKLTQIKFDSSRTAGLESELKLGVGARVMLRRNIDVESGLVNGAMGSIHSFTNDNVGQIHQINIDFDNGQHTKLNLFNVPFELMKGIYVNRKQFPISLAYAITVHKCQGLSLPCALSDVGKSVFGSGMTYVALSRVTSITGLYLLDFSPSKVVADTNAVKEYNRLRVTYRPDLPMLPIPQKRCSTYTMTASCQPTETAPTNDQKLLQQTDANNNTNIRMMHLLKLSNNDKVSCYSNNITQLLLHVPQFKNVICCQETSSATEHHATRQLQHLIGQMQGGEGMLASTASLRRAVHQQYETMEQKDAFEFLVDLLHTLQAEETQLHELVTGIEGEEEQCTNCNHRTITGHDQFQVMRMYFPEAEDTSKPIKFSEMLNQWFSFDRHCNLCGSAMQRRTVIRVAPQFLFITLCKFQQKARLLSRPITGYTASNVKIAGTHYRTVGAVCHEGETTRSGHYWCHLRHDQHWLRVNDCKVDMTSRFVNNLHSKNNSWRTSTECP